MTTIKINQQLKRIEIKEFEIENQIVFNYFDNIPASERDDKLLRAIYIGVLPSWKTVFPLSYQKPPMSWEQS